MFGMYRSFNVTAIITRCTIFLSIFRDIDFYILYFIIVILLYELCTILIAQLLGIAENILIILHFVNFRLINH